MMPLVKNDLTVLCFLCIGLDLPFTKIVLDFTNYSSESKYMKLVFSKLEC